MATSCPTEYAECQVFHQWLELNHIRHTHIGNESQIGGRAGIIRGAKLKAIGQSKGFPDYLLIVNDKLIAIEMKRQKGGKVSDEQRDWLDALAKAGVEGYIAHGANEAMEIVQRYIGRWRKT